MVRLITLAELDRKLEESRHAATVSDDALRAVFTGFEGRFVLDHPIDPFSDEYRTFQMALYERFAQRAYTVSNEITPFDLHAGVLRPFPYSTANAATAGQHWGAVAFLLRCLRLRHGARVLEFGPGSGNLTIALAQLGFAVTAVDVDPSCCEMLRRRARQNHVAINVINADLFWAERVVDPYDAVIFFESFHHCADHLRLLRALHVALRRNGLIYFAAEPIRADYPIPWGLRMDGEALWQVSAKGWLELGFRESYFRAALSRTGWIGRAIRSADLPWVSVWEASEDSREPIMIEAADPRLGTVTGRKSGRCIEVVAVTDGYALQGPHMPLGRGAYRGLIRFTPGVDLRGEMTIDVCSDRGLMVHAAAPVDVEAGRKTGVAGLDFDLSEQADDIEVRLFAKVGSVVSIQQVVLLRRHAVT